MGDKKKFRLNTLHKETPLLFGLLTDASDYKITWILNHRLGIKLRRIDDLIWSNKKHPQNQHFPIYQDTDTSLGQIQLIQNSSIAKVRIPAYRQVDYLLVIRNLAELLEEVKWIELLQNTTEIRGVYKLDYSELQDILG